jgi:hypothetical protein
MTFRPASRNMFAFVMVMLAAVPASAQGERRIGVVAAYPASFGVLWQMTDGFALRGDGSFDWSTIETASTITLGLPSSIPGSSATTTFRSEASNRDVSFGVSALIDLHRRDQLRIYAAPRVALGFSNTTVTMSQDRPIVLDRLVAPETTIRTSRTPAFDLMFGATTRMGERFGVFGEIGAGYSRTLGDDSPVELGGRTFRSRGGVGAILFF